MLRILLILISSLMVVNVNAGDTVCEKRHCLAVVDAGSSGSRLHIYAYDLNEQQQPMQINELWSRKIKPGFSTIDPKPEVIHAYLNSLFANAPENNMPVYFYATAGMRLLPYPKQQEYYQVLKEWFAAQPQWPLKASKTITGSEEGVFGWLAVNYQLGKFNHTDEPLVSVMDMGGASVQVTFPVRDVEHIDARDVMTMNILGRDITLYVHSFLGLGQTLVTQQFLDNEHCFPTDYPLPSGAPAKGDASACQQDVSKLINGVHEVNRVTKEAMAKDIANTWYVMGGPATLVEDKVFKFENNQLTNQGLLQQADVLACHADWKILHAQYPNNDYLSIYCLSPTYYYALMVDGYGLTPQQPIHYLPSGQGADWSLGVVLHHH